MSRKCKLHIDAKDWIDEPHPTRRGWIRTTCKRCGAFIGNRPKEVDQKRKKPGRGQE